MPENDQQRIADLEDLVRRQEGRIRELAAAEHRGPGVESSVFLQSRDAGSPGEPLPPSLSSDLGALSLEEIRQRDAILAAIIRINRQINTLQPADVLLARTLEAAVDLAGAERGVVVALEDGRPVARFAHGFPAGADLAPVFSRLEHTLAEGESSLYANTAETLTSVMAPLERDGRTVGAFYLEKEARGLPFGRMDLDCLATFASQASLALHNAQLYDRLKTQNRELKRMVALKNNFIQHLSKDLKVPLEKLHRALQDMAHLEHCVETTVPVELASRLVRAVDKIVSLSALQREADEMFAHAVDLETLVRDILRALQPAIDTRQLAVTVVAEPGLPPCDGNREILYTVFDEVLGNAVVYNRQGGSIEVRLGQQGRNLRVSVRDTGIGIREEELELVFGRFFRSASSYTLYDRGAGLGLYIVRSFVESYGGSISLASRYGEGTEVLVELPL